MGQRVQIQRFDDITGQVRDDIETVKFGLDGKHYVIDLGPDTGEKFRGLLAPYIDKAERDPEPHKKPAKSGKKADPKLAKVRAWARTQGYEISDRGIVAQHIIDAYDAAQANTDGAPSA